jgi:hypothetical protein
MRFQSLLFAAFCLLTVAACHNHDHDEEDNNPPVLNITAPAEGAVMTKPVALSLNASDESLHEMSISITRDSDGVELFSKEPSVHDETEFIFFESWNPAEVTAETAVTLTVTVEDHSEHKVVKTVKFTVKP